MDRRYEIQWKLLEVAQLLKTCPAKPPPTVDQMLAQMFAGEPEDETTLTDTSDGLIIGNMAKAMVAYRDEWGVYEDHLDKIRLAKVEAKDVLHRLVPESADIRQTPLFVELMSILNTEHANELRTPFLCAEIITRANNAQYEWDRDLEKKSQLEASRAQQESDLATKRPADSAETSWETKLMRWTSLYLVLKWIFWPVIRALTFKRWAFAKLLAGLAAGLIVYWLISLYKYDKKSDIEIFLAKITLAFVVFQFMVRYLDRPARTNSPSQSNEANNVSKEGII